MIMNKIAEFEKSYFKSRLYPELKTKQKIKANISSLQRIAGSFHHCILLGISNLLIS